MKALWYRWRRGSWSLTPDQRSSTRRLKWSSLRFWDWDEGLTEECEKPGLTALHIVTIKWIRSKRWLIQEKFSSVMQMKSLHPMNLIWDFTLYVYQAGKSIWNKNKINNKEFILFSHIIYIRNKTNWFKDARFHVHVCYNFR